ncbi:hypothetical protein [uncultured Jatrophihabitans sp.]|uniref:hypothetical protein n=1 Tax=uncultured Jatrophihabitans sp. TaxID=1610747 RepID=UPI0035CA6B7F
MTATAARPTLPDFESETVARASVKITNAGDGLSEALKVDPIALHMNDVVYYVLRGEVTQINHRTDRDDEIVRVHTVKADQISPIDAGAAQKFLQAYAEETERKKAEIAGQLALDAEQEAMEREANDRHQGNVHRPA